MFLLHDIAGILEGKSLAEVRADLRNMVVREFTRPRSTNSPLRTVLLCESPHREEIYHGHALAGTSGRTVTAALRQIPDIPAIDTQDAIGCLLRGPMQHPIVDSLGIMNVSLLPLQKVPYRQYVQQDDDYKSLLCAFEKVRERVQTGRHGLRFRKSVNSGLALTKMMQQLTDIVLRDLERRLCQLPDSALVIPCGHFAREPLIYSSKLRQ